MKPEPEVFREREREESRKGIGDRQVSRAVLQKVGKISYDSLFFLFISVSVAYVVIVVVSEFIQTIPNYYVSVSHNHLWYCIHKYIFRTSRGAWLRT